MGFLPKLIQTSAYKDKPYRFIGGKDNFGIDTPIVIIKPSTTNKFFYKYKSHSIKGQGEIICNKEFNKICKYCVAGERIIERYLVNIYIREENKIYTTAMPKSVFTEILNIYRTNKIEDIERVTFSISKQGTGLETEYSVSPLLDFDKPIIKDRKKVIRDFKILLEKEINEKERTIPDEAFDHFHSDTTEEEPLIKEIILTESLISSIGKYPLSLNKLYTLKNPKKDYIEFVIVSNNVEIRKVGWDSSINRTVFISEKNILNLKERNMYYLYVYIPEKKIISLLSLHPIPYNKLADELNKYLGDKSINEIKTIPIFKAVKKGNWVSIEMTDKTFPLLEGLKSLKPRMDFGVTEEVALQMRKNIDVEDIITNDKEIPSDNNIESDFGISEEDDILSQFLEG